MLWTRLRYRSRVAAQTSADISCLGFETQVRSIAPDEKHKCAIELFGTSEPLSEIPDFFVVVYFDWPSSLLLSGSTTTISANDEHACEAGDYAWSGEAAPSYGRDAAVELVDCPAAA
jgi:hypothetical protein